MTTGGIFFAWKFDKYIRAIYNWKFFHSCCSICSGNILFESSPVCSLICWCVEDLGDAWDLITDLFDWWYNNKIRTFTYVYCVRMQYILDSSLPRLVTFRAHLHATELTKPNTTLAARSTYCRGDGDGSGSFWMAGLPSGTPFCHACLGAL